MGVLGGARSNPALGAPFTNYLLSKQFAVKPFINLDSEQPMRGQNYRHVTSSQPITEQSPQPQLLSEQSPQPQLLSTSTKEENFRVDEQSLVVEENRANFVFDLHPEEKLSEFLKQL